MRGFSYRASVGWDRVIAADPDGSRLRGAIRATVAAVVALGALVPFTRFVVDGDTRAMMVGVMIAANGAVLPADASRNGRLITAALLPLAATVGFGVGTTILPAGIIVRTGLFAVTAFVAVLARRWGARGNALGMLGFLGFFFAQFLEIHAAKVPAVASGIIVAGALGIVVRILTEQRDTAKLSRTITAIRRGAACLLHDGAKAVSLPHHRASQGLQRAQRAFDRDLALLNSAVLIGEGLASRVVDRRAYMFAIDLAANRFVAAINALEPAASDETRARATAAILSVRRLLRGEGNPRDARAKIDALEEGSLRRLRNVLEDLLTAAENARQQTPTNERQDLRAASTTTTTTTTTSASNPLRPSFATLVQVPIAVVLAFVVGNFVAPGRGYWAVIAAFVVFTRAATLGVALLRAWERIVGTVIGVGAGVVLAEILRGHERLELIALFVSLFVAFYALKRHYAVFVGAFSLLIAIVYGLTGQLTKSVVEVRIIETLVGGACAVFVAAIVLPMRPSQAIAERGAAVLDAVADLITTSFRGTTNDARAALRDLDRRLEQLRDVAEGLTLARLLGMAPELLEKVTAVRSIAFEVRPLTDLGIGMSPAPLIADRVAYRAHHVAAIIRGESPNHPPSSSPKIDTTDDRPSLFSIDPSRRERSIRWLTRADEALERLETIISPASASSASAPG